MDNLIMIPFIVINKAFPGSLSIIMVDTQLPLAAYSMSPWRS